MTHTATISSRRRVVPGRCVDAYGVIVGCEYGAITIGPGIGPRIGPGIGAGLTPGIGAPIAADIGVVIGPATDAAIAGSGVGLGATWDVQVCPSK